MCMACAWYVHCMCMCMCTACAFAYAWGVSYLVTTPSDHKEKALICLDQDRKEKARMICHDPLRFPSPDWDRISDTAKDFCSTISA